MNLIARRVSVPLLATLFLAPVLATGQSAEGLSQEGQAEMMSKLWNDTCAKHFANPEGLRVAVRSFRFQENPSYSREVLAGSDGTVWDASVGPFAQFSIILLKDGTCKVVAKRAASQHVLAAFEKVVLGIRTPGVSVERVIDREVEKAGFKLRQVAYFVSRTGADTGWSFAAVVSDSDAAPTQATISIARTRKP